MKKKLLLFGPVVLFALACLPTEPCACSVVPFQSILSGKVTTASGLPVARAEIRAYAQAASCPMISNRPWPDNVVRSSQESGEYWIAGYQAPPSDQFCLRVVARLPAPAADSVVVERMMTTPTASHVREKTFYVDLVFPAN